MTKKFQLPVIGGIRKVLYVPPTVATGTAIAGLEGQTITLPQLATLVNNTITPNTGGGNIGGGGSGNASIALGPGLSGGGPLVGNVPIRLTAPIPWFDDGGGADGDPGPPGVAGAKGVNGATGGVGPTGPAVFMAGEDGADGMDAIPGPQGPQGVTGSQGPQGIPGVSGSGSSTGLAMWIPDDTVTDEEIYRGPNTGRGYTVFNGPVVANQPLTINNASSAAAAVTFTVAGANWINASSASGSLNLATGGNARMTIGLTGAIIINAPTSLAQALAVNGISGTNALLVQAGATNNQSDGVQINAGTSVSDYALAIIDATGTKNYAKVYGDGGVTIGVAATADKGAGTLNVQNGIYAAGVLVAGGANSTPAGVHHGMIAEDPPYDDEPISVAPVPTSVGPLTVNGPLKVNSGTTGTAMTVNGVGGTTIASFVGNMGSMTMDNTGTQIVYTFNGFNYLTASGASAHLQLQAGAGFNLTVNGTNVVLVRTGVQMGAPAGGDLGAGTLNVQNFVSVNGATPAPATGRTDIGITTTSTVITTAGGVAIPVLAATMWVVNVNGVQYGVPCFAL